MEFNWYTVYTVYCLLSLFSSSLLQKLKSNFKSHSTAKFYCRLWKSGKQLKKQITLRLWITFSLRYVLETPIVQSTRHKCNKVSSNIDFCNIIALMLFLHIFPWFFIQMQEKLQNWSNSFAHAFQNRNFEEAKIAIRRMTYYSRVIDEVVKKLWYR